jgi:site-specific DNA-methyltransferase (adenine-specific)
LSNDEIFTPPDFANEMLDTVAGAWAHDNGGKSIWSDSRATFLDPFTKSGVFLREITRRLIEGLVDEIPDLQCRVDHILTNQVFGIGITKLTALIARRSLYCSKYSNGEHSVVTSFTAGEGYGSADGHIWFERVEHSWEKSAFRTRVVGDDTDNSTRRTTGKKCRFCGASSSSLDRGPDFETHAYAFTHTAKIKERIDEIFGAKMKFDVVIGNPPYQLDDGGFGTSAAPIYQDFVNQAKSLEPRYLSMVIPARWYAGGKGLDDFRETMLDDRRIRVIHDYWQVGDVFPGVAIQGGILYFLWSQDDPGDCEVVTHYEGKVMSAAERPLREPGADVFIRFNEAVSILKKVVAVEGGSPNSVLLPKDKRFADLVSSRKPFGLDTKFKVRSVKQPKDVAIYWNGGPGFKKAGKGWVAKAEIEVGRELIDKWKVFVGGAYGDRGGGGASRDAPPRAILGKPFLGEPGSVSTETYICIGPFASQTESENVISYIACKLTRFLVMLHKPSQHATQKVYTFVPAQDFSRPWTDAQLYEKYGLTEEEITFVDWMIRPMDVG